MFDYRLDDGELLKLRDRFEKVYIRTYPKPKPFSSAFVRWALILIVVASMIVSASHTIPAFLSTIETDSPSIIKLLIALSAFTMVEAGVLAFAYISTRRHGVSSDKRVNQRLIMGLMLAFSMAVVANLHSVLEPRVGGTQVWDIFSFMVFALVGISAPTLAYIAGECYGLTTLSDEQHNREGLANWHTAFDAAWEQTLEKYQRNAVRVDRMSTPQLRPVVPVVHQRMSAGHVDMDMDNRADKVVDKTEDIPGHGTGSGYTKRSNPEPIVRQYFLDHPEDFELDVRTLASKIGVSKSTVSNVRRKILGQD